MFKESPYFGSLDYVLRQLGDFGAFNIKIYALLLLPVYLAGMHAQVFVFEALDIDYRCKIKECEGTGNSAKWMPFAIPASQNHRGYARCSRYTAKKVLTADQPTCVAHLFTKKVVKCKEYVYNEKTAVKDFNLGCKDSTKALIAACHNAGLFISLPLAGYVSDRFGRKVALSAASLMAFIFGLMRSFSVNFYMLLALETIEAGLGSGAYTTSFVIGMEIVHPDSRVIAGTIINSMYIFGTASLGLIAWMLHDWRLILKVIYSPAILIVSYIWILDDTVRWLLSKGRNHEAITVLEKAAKMNKVTLKPQIVSPENSSEKSLDHSVSNISQMSEEQHHEKPKKSSARQVYESAEVRRKLAHCSMLWFTSTLVYYSLSFNSVYIDGNKYINYVMVSFIEIPAFFAYLAIHDKFGRKKLITYAFIVGSIACLGLVLIPNDYALMFLSLYLFAKFFITIAYTSVYYFVSDVFPDHLRHFLLAISISVGKFGTVLAPFTPLLAVYYYNLPAILFGSLAGAAVFHIAPLNTVHSDNRKPWSSPIDSHKNTKLCSVFLLETEVNFFR